MVGEFPELQGLMGGYYAAAQGEHPAVAAAIRDHYKPVGQGDDVPTDPVTVAVSLADKLDTLVGFFSAGLLPTGSKDPFALRRAALGCISLLVGNQIRLPIFAAYAQETSEYLRESMVSSASATVSRDFEAFRRTTLNPADFNIDEYLGSFVGSPVDDAVETFFEGAFPLLDFFADRLKVQQREAGVRHDLIDAVFALGGEDDLVRLLARVHALQAFVTTEDGKNLLAGYKRAANILKKETAPKAVTPANAGVSAGSEGHLPHETPAFAGVTDGAGDDGVVGAPGEQPLSYTPEPAEAALMTALDSAEPRATTAIAREDFAAAMAALASLRAPIDAFFDSVIVNDADPAKRSARLALLERVRAAVHNVADFSKIEG